MIKLICENCGKLLTPRQLYRGNQFCGKGCATSWRTRGKPSRNKGKPMSEEQKLKISNSNKGKKLSKETKDKISRSLKAYYKKYPRKPMSKELRELHRKLYYKQVEALGKTSLFQGHHHTDSTKKYLHKLNTDPEFNQENSSIESKRGYSKVAFEFYDSKCEYCGSTQFLHVHHLNGDHYDDRVSNLCILCRDCHLTKAHINRGSTQGLDIDQGFSKSIMLKRIAKFLKSLKSL